MEALLEVVVIYEWLISQIIFVSAFWFYNQRVTIHQDH